MSHTITCADSLKHLTRHCGVMHNNMFHNSHTLHCHQHLVLIGLMTACTVRAAENGEEAQSHDSWIYTADVSPGNRWIGSEWVLLSDKSW